MEVAAECRVKLDPEVEGEVDDLEGKVKVLLLDDDDGDAGGNVKILGCVSKEGKED